MGLRRLGRGGNRLFWYGVGESGRRGGELERFLWKGVGGGLVRIIKVFLDFRLEL